MIKMMKKITKSLEDYLEAILILELKKKALHSINIARFLKVSKPAVTRALNDLAKLKYVEKSRYEDVVLTKAGREAAKKIYHRHIIIRQSLIDIGVSPKTAERDCCLIEHVISNETLKVLEKLNK
ncbi:MAG: metal-dependent transcriptional regulator [Bacilli bacterium]|nr:metal-dependent transcriptional regulator [Bacilli bacterium]